MTSTLAAVRLALGTLAAAAIVTAAVPGDSPVSPDVPERDAEAGRQIYRIYCHGCHGPDGRGDGPAASGLTVAPTDLTVLAAAAGGTFDRDAVYAAIEGIDRSPGHGAGEMPLWGFAFRQFDRDTESVREIRTRLWHLVDYLESIQDGVAESR